MTAQTPDLEAVARAIYDLDPYTDPGENIDGFQVVPGGDLTWSQACKIDAEFGDDVSHACATEMARCAGQAAIDTLSVLGWVRVGEGEVVVPMECKE